MIYALLILSGFLMGFGIGQIVRDMITRKTIDGVLRIDHSDPNDRPYIFLELKSDPEVIGKHKFVTIEVSTKNYISQK